MTVDEALGELDSLLDQPTIGLADRDGSGDLPAWSLAGAGRAVWYVRHDGEGSWLDALDAEDLRGLAEAMLCLADHLGQGAP